MMAGFDVPWTEIVTLFFLLTMIFLFIFGQCLDNYKYNLFTKRKIGVTGRPRSLNPSKAIGMAICPIIVQFSS